MLSQENVNKLVKTGLYKHEPDKRYRGSLYWNDSWNVYGRKDRQVLLFKGD